jgi:transposase
MRKSLSPGELGFVAQDRRQLSKAMARNMNARLFRRLQAVLLLAKGRSFAEVADTVGLSLRSVYYLAHRYLQSHHRPRALADKPRSGRPALAPELTRDRILRALRRSPLPLGYRTNVWTVDALALHLNGCHSGTLSARTLRRRMKQIGLVCKRPRYFYSEKDPHRAQKKGGAGAANQADARPRRAAF